MVIFSISADMILIGEYLVDVGEERVVKFSALFQGLFDRLVASSALVPWQLKHLMAHLLQGIKLNQNYLHFLGP